MTRVNDNIRASKVRVIYEDQQLGVMDTREAVEKAKAVGMTVVGMTGESGGKMKTLCEVLLNAPSSNTPRIQECHILMGHIICELCEKGLFDA